MATVPSVSSVLRTRYFVRLAIRCVAAVLLILAVGHAIGPIVGLVTWVLDSSSPKAGGGGMGWWGGSELLELDVPWSIRVASVMDVSFVAAVGVLFGKTIVHLLAAGFVMLLSGRIVGFVAPMARPGCPVCGYVIGDETLATCPECGQRLKDEAQPEGARPS
ncbi:MAG: hypothetical protein H6811_08440 [Phycisphaeraceae bacterium]|nr:hypothetical protein [Phycisphaeraceae bacterium]